MVYNVYHLKIMDMGNAQNSNHLTNVSNIFLSSKYSVRKSSAYNLKQRLMNASVRGNHLTPIKEGVATMKVGSDTARLGKDERTCRHIPRSQ